MQSTQQTWNTYQTTRLHNTIGSVKLLSGSGENSNNNNKNTQSTITTHPHTHSMNEKWKFLNDSLRTEDCYHNLFSLLSNLKINETTTYKNGNYSYSAIKKNQFQIIQTNLQTFEQRTIQSSKLDELKSNLGDDEIETYIAQIGKEKIRKWIFCNEFKVQVSLKEVLCEQLNRLKVGQSLIRYKHNFYYYNFYKVTEDQVIQINDETGTARKIFRKRMPAKIWVAFEEDGILYEYDKYLSVRLNDLNVNEKLTYQLGSISYETTMQMDDKGSFFGTQKELRINTNKEIRLIPIYDYQWQEYLLFRKTLSFKSKPLSNFATMHLNQFDSTSNYYKSLTPNRPTYSQAPSNANSVSHSHSYTQSISPTISSNSHSNFDEKTNDNIKNSNNSHFETSLTNEEIESKFYNTIDKSNFIITRIEPIDNMAHNGLDGTYNACLRRIKKMFLQENKDLNKLERWLFHGTKESNIDKILNNGFDRNFNITSAHGYGVYFARDASYSRLYCQNDSGKYPNELCMLLCKVIVGQYTKGSYNMKKIPLKKDNKTQYETLVDDVNDPSIFVVTRDYFAVPAYRIWFKKATN